MDKNIVSLQKALQNYLNACDKLQDASQNAFNNVQTTDERNLCLSANSIISVNASGIQIAKDILQQIDVMNS